MILYQERGLTPSGGSGPAGEPRHIKIISVIQNYGLEMMGAGLWAPRPAERLLTVSGPFLDLDV